MGPAYQFEEVMMVAGAMLLFFCATPQIDAWFSKPAGFRKILVLQRFNVLATSTKDQLTLWTAYQKQQASRAATQFPPPPPTRASRNL
jgi:hypothetical protein